MRGTGEERQGSRRVSFSCDAAGRRWWDGREGKRNGGGSRGDCSVFRLGAWGFGLGLGVLLV